MFTHLHLHTEYSLLDGFCRLPQLFQQARELGFKALAITDHGALYGIIDFYLGCKEAGMKPIIGGEIYLSRAGQDKNPYHLILLAKNNAGYKNLIKLVTLAHLEGFYYKPQVSKEWLAKYSEGLIALSACPQGELSRLILEGRWEEAAQAALWYKRVFSDFYLEVQVYPLPELEKINQGLYRLSRELGLPLVATGDVHYIRQEDAPIHDILLCIQTNTTVYQEKRLKMPGDFFYLRSPQEMLQLFSDLPQAVQATEEIADKCEVELELGGISLPSVSLPEEIEVQEYLEKLAWEGLYRRFPQPSPELVERLKYELNVIRETKFAPYFLIVYDLACFARGRKILFGVRGSAASSLVLYVLGLTEVNPLDCGLVFERFLNVERKELPDIDLDFEDQHRQEVIDYLSLKYGSDRVAQIITFGTMGARAAIRDVGRALGFPYSEVDRIAKLLPQEIGITLGEALRESPELNRRLKKDEEVAHLFDIALKLEGTIRHASTHAAGIVIAPEPLTNFTPLQRPIRASSKLPMTQFDMGAVAKVGLLKLDILGLANLTILARTKELIKQSRGIEIDLHRLPLDDTKTFSFLSNSQTAGVFQLESPGMRKVIRELKPSSFSDLAAIIALYRPGPKEHIPEFIRAKYGQPISYPHPAIADILRETYGVIVYQDQVLLIVRALAGYSLGEADMFRKAMGKKIPQMMEEERGRFISRAIERGIPEEVAAKVFELIKPFAGYAFNKAHSVSYALLAYQTAYFKANYPTEYMTCLLNTSIEKTEKLASAIAECYRLGIKVHPPDINHSQTMFTMEDGKAIRFGLLAIKNVGEGVVEPILTARRMGGPFKSVEDFCLRVDLRAIGRRGLESLIKAGALDCLGERGSLFYNLDKLISLSEQHQRIRKEGQISLFDMESLLAYPSLQLEDVKLGVKERFSWEKEALGFSLWVIQGENGLSSLVVTFCSDIQAERKGKKVAVVGVVSYLSERQAKNGKVFLSALIEDLTGSLEVIVSPELYVTTKELWQEGKTLVIEGKVEVREGKAKLIAEGIQLYLPPSTKKRLLLHISREKGKTGQEFFRQLLALLTQYPGRDEVCLLLDTDYGSVTMEWPGVAVNYSAQLHHRLAEFLGEQAINLEKVPS